MRVELKNSMNANIRPRGFTLIELLVVIAIIGILASIILVAVSGARAKARDIQRVANARQVRNMLELYAADHNTYPDSGSDWAIQTGCGYTGYALINTLLAGYGTLPDDPNGGGCIYYMDSPIDHFPARTDLAGDKYVILIDAEQSATIAQGQGCWPLYYCVAQK